MNRKNGFYWVKFMGVFVIAAWDNGWKMFNGARLYDDNFTYIGENPVEPPAASHPTEPVFTVEQMKQAYFGGAHYGTEAGYAFFKQTFNIDL